MSYLKLQLRSATQVQKFNLLPQAYKLEPHLLNLYLLFIRSLIQASKALTNTPQLYLFLKSPPRKTFARAIKLDLLPRQLNKLNYPSYSDRDRLYFSIYLRLALTQNDHLVKVHRSFDLFFKTPHRRNWIYLQVGRLENR